MKKVFLLILCVQSLLFLHVSLFLLSTPHCVKQPSEALVEPLVCLERVSGGDSGFLNCHPPSPPRCTRRELGRDRSEFLFLCVKPDGSPPCNPPPHRREEEEPENTTPRKERDLRDEYECVFFSAGFPSLDFRSARFFKQLNCTGTLR